MRPVILMALLGAMLIAFQNCGGDLRTQGLFAEELASSASVDENCEGGLCVKPEELLWIKIRESEPYRVNTKMLDSGHFNTGGTCGSSTFSQHVVIYKLEEAFGNSEPAGAGYLDNICDLGHFQAAISPNIKGNVVVNQKYILTLEIVGLGEGNQPVSNPMPANVSRIEVIFVSEEP